MKSVKVLVAERDATRSTAFDNDRLNYGWREMPVQVMFAGDLSARTDVHEIWIAAASEITQWTSNRISFAFQTQVGDYGIIVTSASSPQSCRFETGWSLDVAGFCVDAPGDPYFADRLNVLPQRLTDRAVALRGLLWLVALKAHAQPGLLNASRPATELSEFERKTLGMIGVRPSTLRWPDADQ